jgi:hypothetical protein
MKRIEHHIDQLPEQILDSEWLALPKYEQMQRDPKRYWDSARRMSAIDAVRQISEEELLKRDANNRLDLGVRAVDFVLPRHRA